MAQFAAGLQALGLEAGDRVRATPHTKPSVTVAPQEPALHLCRVAGCFTSRACVCPNMLQLLCTGMLRRQALASAQR